MDLGASSVTLSPELPAGAVRALAQEPGIGVIVYGRLPVMTLSRCVICGGACRKGNAGGRISPDNARPHRCASFLTDRRGEVFPVLGQPDCTNLILNSVPTVMSDRMTELGRPGFIHFLFESPDPSVLDCYERGIPMAGRRI
jgi:hypothetical protein